MDLRWSNCLSLRDSPILLILLPSKLFIAILIFKVKEFFFHTRFDLSDGAQQPDLNCWKGEVLPESLFQPTLTLEWGGTLSPQKVFIVTVSHSCCAG